MNEYINKIIINAWRMIQLFFQCSKLQLNTLPIATKSARNSSFIVFRLQYLVSYLYNQFFLSSNKKLGIKNRVYFFG